MDHNQPRDSAWVTFHFLPLQITGLGALVVTPVVGNLSDRYGRKALLAIPATLSVVPLGKLSNISHLTESQMEY
jgi:MFS family permease